MRHRQAISAVAVVALALMLAACGGGDAEGEDATATPAASEAPSQSPAPQRAPGSLPPEFLTCVADQGYEIESPNEIHSLPMEVLQKCFGSLHGGGGAR
jgi:glucose/arabinose dehydrogenase